MEIENTQEAIENPGLLLTKEQLKYIKDKFNIDVIPNYYTDEFDDLYESLSDLEVDEWENDDKEGVAGDIVTIFGDLIDKVELEY